MGTITHWRCTKPLPKGAQIEVDPASGQKIVRWRDRDGEKSAPLVDRNGSPRILHTASVWIARYVDENGLRQKLHTGVTDEATARKILQRLEDDVTRKRAERGDFTKCASPTLDNVLDLYLVHRRLAPNSALQLRLVIPMFAKFLGHPATVSDLTDDLVSGWIAQMEASHSQATVASHRMQILCLWRFAAKRKLCPPPEDVRRCPPPEPMPIAWELDTVRKLIAACTRITGTTHGVPVGQLFRALILAAYDTGLRRGDLWRIHRSQMRADGTVVLRQHKTGRRHFPKLRPETLAAVLALPGDYPLRWTGGEHNAGNFYRAWGNLRRLAGIPGHGGLHQLRRTGATFVAKEHGMDAARRFLGHRSPEMVAHYVDESIALQQTYLPPALS
jgi:integrase